MKRSSLARKTPLRNGPPLVRLRTPRIRLGRPRMDPALRQAIYDRSHGRCDLCGCGLAPSNWECHHRLLRSRGGKDEPANLIALHHTCHRAMHDMPEWADAHGFTVPSWADPAAWPVHRRKLRWQQPCDGEWVGSQPAPGQAGAA